jgi:adenylate cyclase
MVVGVLFATVEYLIKLGSNDPQDFWPLILRTMVFVAFMSTSIGVFEIAMKHHFNQRSFLYLVFLKAFSYTLMLSFWLFIINGFWEMTTNQLTFWGGVHHYLNDPMYFINMISIFVVLLIFSSLVQINSLHRKGELFNFVTGRYHQPVEVDRIFAFVDLKGSTSIAEKLGHYQFGLFLKDYYSDLTEPIRNTKAEIYQYVGDEVILTWPPALGTKNNNAVRCIIEMQKVIEARRDYYTKQYGYIPQFRTGMHLGRVLITWVGELKKEILYIGDVMNTTARIQEDCKRLKQDFLVSEEIVDGLNSFSEVKIDFQEQTVPRGKEKAVRLYSVVKHPDAVLSV